MRRPCGKSKTDAGRRKIKVRPVLRDALLELRAATPSQPPPQNGDPLVFGTAQGKPQNPSNVRKRVVARTVERANERLQEAGEAPLPALTPHGLRRSFASLLYSIGEPPPVVMQEMGHTDPALAPSIYAHAMRRGDGENERLRALVDGVELPGLVTSDHSEDRPGPVELRAA
jgi:integrase